MERGSRPTYEEVVERGGRVADAMIAFRTLLGGTDMLAYLAMMAPRLIELRRVLKPTGCTYEVETTIHPNLTPSALGYIPQQPEAIKEH